MRLTRALLAAPIGALLAGGVWSGTAVAQDPEPPGLVADLCAAADLGQVNALLEANVDVGLPAGVRDAVDPTVAGGTLDEVQSRLGCAEQPPPDDGTDEPGTDQPGDDNTGAGTDVPPAEQPVFDNCVDAIAAGSIQPATRGVDDSYQANLDPNGNGVSCEADETAGGSGNGTGDGTGNGSGSGSDSGSDGSGTLGGDDSAGGSGSVDSIPEGSVDTGYAPR